MKYVTVKSNTGNSTIYEMSDCYKIENDILYKAPFSGSDKFVEIGEISYISNSLGTNVVPRYIQVKNGKIIDTTLLLPNVECYTVTDGKLYIESSTDKSQYYLGEIVNTAETLVDFINKLLN